MHLLHIWRPEACGDGQGAEPHRQSPFDGMETYECDDETAALALADRLAGEHPKWHFHIDTARPWNS